MSKETMSITVLECRKSTKMVELPELPSDFTVADLKKEFAKSHPKLYPDRQSFRVEQRGKSLPDEQVIGKLNVDKLYFKDLGPQIGWSTVFLCEYVGPLFAYWLFYIRPSLIYAGTDTSKAQPFVVKLACACWTAHYVKRVLETLFVHRFSHATMPWRNLLKNCSYYWGFAGFISYYINHPLYTVPMYGTTQMYAGLAGFVFCELGNLFIHTALRDLRPPGSKERRIPKPTSNPFTMLFSFVSCPNYTYEAGAWLSFSLMSQSLPALLFTIAGFYQMAVWAIGKHKRYRREFKDYPRGRKAIVPFLL